MLITIIMPALNEEKNIISAVDDTLSAFKEFRIDGEVLVINDGSTDSTAQLVKQKIGQLPDKVRMLTHTSRRGIGASFWGGVDNAKGDIVCMLPGDNENDPREILRYSALLHDVDLVIPFVFNRQVRPKLRNFLSANYHRFINCTFSTSFNYTTGTVLYRKSLLKELNKRRMGFFFQTDILIRLVKQGYLFAEVPYKLRKRQEGSSKAVRLRSLGDIIVGYSCLVKDIHFKKRKTRESYAKDSATEKRYRTV